MKAKNLIIAIAVFTTILFGGFLFTKKAQASTTLAEFMEDTDLGEGNMEQWQTEGWGNDVFSMVVALVGRENMQNLLAQDGKKRLMAKDGAIGGLNNLIGLAFSYPPASAVYYASDLLQQIGGKPVYAQGIGFTGLQPILPIWRGFRNATYLLLAIVFIVIGLAIMFRAKISAQTIVTIENALPRLVGALVLITFSYAIAGLVIDISYVLLALTMRILMAAGFSLPGQTFADLTNFNFFDAFQLVYRAVPFAVIESLAVVMGAILGGLLGVLGGLVTLPTGIIGGMAIGPAIVYVVILVVIIFSLLKFFFSLIKYYVNAILQIVLAPLKIMMGAVPGLQSESGFGQWFQVLVANILVFPICSLFLIVANIIIDAGSRGLWAPTLLGPGQTGGILAGVSGLSGGLVSVALGLGVISMLSNLPDVVFQSVFSIKPPQLGGPDIPFAGFVQRTGLQLETASRGAVVSAPLSIAAKGVKRLGQTKLGAKLGLTAVGAELETRAGKLAEALKGGGK